MDYSKIACGKDGCGRPVDGHFHEEKGHKWYPVIQVTKKGRLDVHYYHENVLESSIVTDGFRVVKSGKK